MQDFPGFIDCQTGERKRFLALLTRIFMSRDAGAASNVQMPLCPVKRWPTRDMAPPEMP